MSYRVKVNDHQIFGNNETYPEWNAFIESQGITIDAEYCYNGEIKDIMQAITVLERITLRLHQERLEQMKQGIKAKNIFDLTHIPEELENQPSSDKFNNSLLDCLIDITTHGYMFLPQTLIKACENKLEQIQPYNTPGHFHCYRIKDGEIITVSAN